MSGTRLDGWRVLVTRQPDQSGGLARALEGAGAEVVEVPLIEIAPPSDPAPLREAVSRLADYDWLVFTSANAVRAVAAAEGPRVLPENLRLATVGAATSRALLKSFPGATVTLTPVRDFRAEALLVAFADQDIRGRRVLLPASARAPDTLAAGLTALGARVDVVTAYRTITPGDAPVRLAAALLAGVDVLTLASPSAVDGFAASCPPGSTWPPAVVIGPVTEKAAREAGFQVAGVSVTAGPEGILDVLSRLTRPR